MKYNITYYLKKKKLAFCFLIYDKINHEDLWNDFLKNVDNSKYSIFIHYKINTPLKHFEKYKLNNCIETSWGDYRISLAQNLMIKEGINENTHFIFLSGACIPLKSFDYIYDNLDKNYSYFNKTPDVQSFPRCNKVLEFIDKRYIKKANTNSIINNNHARIILDNEYLIKKWFSEINNADEHCHLTLLYYFNKEKELKLTPNTSYSGATTFAPWDDMDDYMTFPKSIKSNSYTYDMIGKDELEYLINSACLFGRKFNDNCTVEGESLKENVLKRINPIFGGFIPKKKYLLFSSVSKRSNEKQAVEYWNDGDRKYDIVLAYYKDDVPDNCNDFCFKREGFKLPNFYYFASNYDISSYDAIFIVDDDIIMTSQDINKMFDIFIENKLLVAAPSMDDNSDIHYSFQKRNKLKDITYTNFIEVGTLLLDKSCIPKLLNLFKESGSGWGADIIIPYIIKPNKRQMGIINKVSSHHPKITDINNFTKSSSKCLNIICSNNKVIKEGQKLLNKYNISDIQIEVY